MIGRFQLTDPLLQVAKPIMTEFLRLGPASSTVLLCRIFRETVLCVHQATEANTGTGVSYERGRPMPLFKGATSKIILAYLPLRDLRRLYEVHRMQIATRPTDAQRSRGLRRRRYEPPTRPLQRLAHHHVRVRTAHGDIQ